MLRTVSTTAAAALALSLWTSVAAAQPTVTEAESKQLADVAIAELKRTEVVPHKTLFASLIAGYHGDVAGFGELRVGYGTGRYKQNLVLPTITMWRVSAAVRGAYGRTDSVAASLLGGWGKVSLLGITLEAGVDAHLSPGDVALGPIASVGLRVGPFGLHMSVWTHVTGEETEGGVAFGLGYTIKDFKSPTDVAKERAARELKARGIPLPP